MASLFYIDTHNHIDAPVFDNDRGAFIRKAKECGVIDAIICAGYPEGFSKTVTVAREFHWHYALGIHPLFVSDLRDLNVALNTLRDSVEAALNDSLFVGIGEIGLDRYDKTIPWETSLTVFREQLRLAKHYDLPVSVHARRAVDAVTHELGKFGLRKGIVHAFNGSEQQAGRLLAMGFKLGFGGAMTYEGSLRIRRLFSQIPSNAYVLETDAPDMPSKDRRDSSDKRTRIEDISAYARIGAALRNVAIETISKESLQNSYESFPRLRISV